MNKPGDYVFKRGIEFIGLTDNQLLVKANIEEVSQAFCQVRQAIDWKRDVYRKEVEITDLCFIIYLNFPRTIVLFDL